MLKAFLRLLARLPLPMLHGLGSAAGWIIYLLNRKLARRARANLADISLQTDLPLPQLVQTSIREMGKGLTESFAIWFREPQQSLSLVRECRGWQHVETALGQGHGIIFLTPHLGCFEITAQYYAARHPMSVLFKPSAQGWLAPLVEAGRSRSQLTLAPTNMRGVRTLLKTLRQGQAVGILPDQVPEPGEGVWATFFDKPAYTMTLASKLAETTQATVLLAFGERLPWGRGYIIHIEPLLGEATPQNINNGIEQLVRQRPEQYLWSYRRFKQP